MTTPAQIGSANKHPPSHIVALAVLAFCVGVIASLGAIVFVEAVRLINDLLLISPRSRVLYDWAPLLVTSATVLVPVFGGLVVGLLWHWASDAKRSLGPADAIAAVQTRKPLPSLKAGISSTLAAAISLGCGASVGQYGPMVYLGAVVGGLAARLNIGVRNLQAIAIACGVAAAIATAFNAPIAGLIFAHEVILRHYSIRAFAPVTVASATGYVIANVIFDRPPLFLVNFDGVGHSYEFFLFAVIGGCAALLAIAYMRCILGFAALAKRSPLPVYLRPAMAGLAVGLVALVLPDILGIGAETLRFTTIEGAFEPWELGLILAAKILLTGLCIGYGFAGGVFSPALLIGALFGALFWVAIDALALFSTSGIAVYVICGMMALAGPVVGAPLTMILIVFELTRSYDLTIAAMVSVVFANLLASRLFARSLFDRQLVERGIDLSDGRDQALLVSAFVSDLVRTDYVRCTEQDKLSYVLNRLTAAGRAEAVVVDETGRFLGLVGARDIWGKEKQPVTELCRPAAVMFDETTTLWEAMIKIQDFVGDAVPVVRAGDGHLIGMVAEGELIQAYMSLVHDLRREENEAL